MTKNGRITPPDPRERATEPLLPAPAIPVRIGPYKIHEVLGEGGMGIVYLAEQEEPIRRRVALKLIKLGMDTEQVIARFESERQALALMSHPNIAKVFDAGSTERGRPYFVMEYVPGIPITDYCDQHRLTMRQRLDLFTAVCEAIQHAHQKGIIHRDIKPSNVLVTVEEGKPRPLVIDFGVAKATSQRMTERTLYTEQGVLVGTPQYMSPEQAGPSALDIDTRTDIYSLGLLLYELLVGVLPFESRRLRLAALDELLRIIREEEPPKPSTKVSGLGNAAKAVADLRHTDLRSLGRQLRDDLDWITMKALEKDRTRRYASAQEMAADIERHLQGRPVLAGPPSKAYRANKFVRRHKVGVTMAAAGLVVLIVFAGAMAYQAHRIARERDRANRETAAAERVAAFLSDMLGDVEAEALGRLLVTDLRERIETAWRKRGASDEEVETALASFGDAMRGVNATDAGLRLLDEQVLDRAAQTIEQQLEEEPRIAARLEHTIGVTYRNLGLYPQAEPHALAAVEIRARVLGDDHPDTLDSVSSLAQLYWHQGRFDEAEPMLLETLETRRRAFGDDSVATADSLNDLASMYGMWSRYDDAEPLLVETLEIRKRLQGDDHRATLATMQNLAYLYFRQGRYDDAEPLQLEVLEARGRTLGDDHPDTIASIGILAQLYWRQGRYDEAEPLARKNFEARRRTLGDDNPYTLGALTDLANLHTDQGRHDEAEPLYLEVLDATRRVLGDDHPYTLMSTDNLARFFENQGRYDEAETLHRETLETRNRLYGEEHPETAYSMTSLGTLYAKQGHYDEAEPLLLQSLDVRKRTLGEGHPMTLSSMNNLALVYQYTGRYDEAEPLYLAALEGRRHTVGDEHPRTIGLIDTVARFYMSLGRSEDARPFVTELAFASHRAGDSARAIQWMEAALSHVPADDTETRRELERHLAEFRGQ